MWATKPLTLKQIFFNVVLLVKTSSLTTFYGLYFIIHFFYKVTQLTMSVVYSTSVKDFFCAFYIKYAFNETKMIYLFPSDIILTLQFKLFWVKDKCTEILNNLNNIMICNTFNPKGPSCMRHLTVLLVFSSKLTHYGKYISLHITTYLS